MVSTGSVEAWIDFAGDKHRLGPDDQLLFGRGDGADLNIDDNPLLHRRFGRIYYRDGGWWLRNEGGRLPLSVNDRDSKSAFTLASGAEVSLTFSESAIRFSAGTSNYEILVDLTITGSRPNLGSPDDLGIVDATTIDQSSVPVVGGQRLLLVALAEDKLRNPHLAISLPSNKSVVNRLGWTTTQFNRKLDRLCHKFARAGVSGLVGDSSDHASDRRRRLVEHTVKVGVISAADLQILDEYPT